MKTKALDAVIAGTVTIARLEIEKALAPLHAKIASLEVENGVLREAVKQMRQDQALAALTPDSLRRRYEALQ
jgi:hypothetical protein